MGDLSGTSAGGKPPRRGQRSARRAQLWLRVAAVCLIVCLGVAVVGRSTADAAIPLGPRAGVTAGWNIVWLSDFERQVELNHIAATGAKWFGMDIDWNAVQPRRNAWNWGPFDTVVRQARARGLQIVGTLAYSPKWAVPATCPAGTTHCFPANPADFARFARKAAERYGNASPIAALRGSITTWQIWNEPNHYPFVQPKVDVAFYTEMLKQSYVAIHTADFWTTVLAGGTAPAPDDPSGRDMSPNTFLSKIYALGGQKYFDAFAHHPSSFPCSPLYEAPWNAFGHTAVLYVTMTRNGDARKKIWGTEAGAPTGADLGTCPSNAGVSVTEPVQAWFVHDYLWGWTVKFGAFTGPLIWFSIRDLGTNKWVRDENFGLLRRDFTAKPSYQVFTAMMKGG
jgi:hypothetical protein